MANVLPMATVLLLHLGRVQLRCTGGWPRLQNSFDAAGNNHCLLVACNSGLSACCCWRP